MGVAEPVEVHGWRGELALEFAKRGGRTTLAQRRHDGPLVVQKPLYPEGDGVCHAILVHPPGGIAGGDQLFFDARAGADTHVLLTTPAAGKWYRSIGPWAQQSTKIEAAAGACVEWLPQETIIFDRARANISLEVELDANSVFIGWEILCLGRTGAGERYTEGECRFHSRISREDKVIWFERGLMPAGGLFCTSAAGLGGATVCGTMIAAAEGVSRDLLTACRTEAPIQGRAAVTQMPDVLVARYVGDSSESARNYFQRVWAHVRPALTGRAAVTPRIWST